MSAAFAQRVWRASGFQDPRPFERRFGEADVSLLGLLRVVRDFVGEDAALQLFRTIGTAAAQIAESEIALLRSRMEAPLIVDQRYVEIARTYRNLAGELFPRVSEAIDTLHRHHVETIARRYIGSSPSAANVVPLAIGFADMSGYTGISTRLDAEKLGIMLDRFEAVTGDVVAASGASIVKRIGDAVMYVTNAPGVACTLGLDLVDACATAAPPQAARRRRLR